MQRLLINPLLILLANVCGFATVGCSPPEQRGQAPSGLPDVVLAQPSPPSNVSEMKFRDKVLGEKVQRIFKAAEKLARPDWKHKPLKAFPDGPTPVSSLTSWATLDDEGDALNYHGPREVNYLALGANLDFEAADPKARFDVIGTSVHARWKPAERGWSVSIDYRTYNGKGKPGTDYYTREAFSCRWQHYGKLPAEEQTHTRGLGFDNFHQVAYSRSFVFGKDDKPFPTRYQFHVASHDEGDFKNAVPDKRIREILASPESLRDHLVDANSKLLKRVIAEIGQKGFTPRHSNEPLYERPQQNPWEKKDGKYVSDRRLTEADKKHVIKDATDEIEARIRIAREHCKELHGAIPNAFPLLEALSEK